MFEALNSSFGIKIKTQNPERLRLRLATLRREDKQFKVLSLVIAPGKTDELWIVKKVIDE